MDICRAKILDGCSICPISHRPPIATLFVVCPRAEKVGETLHTYASLEAESPDGVTSSSLSLIQVFAAVASALRSISGGSPAGKG